MSPGSTYTPLSAFRLVQTVSIVLILSSIPLQCWIFLVILVSTSPIFSSSVFVLLLPLCACGALENNGIDGNIKTFGMQCLVGVGVF
jgi:hypothetical protein